MTKILHINCSPRGEAGESTRLSGKVVGFLIGDEPDAVVMTRDLTASAIPHVDRDYAISQASVSDVSSNGSMAASEQLIEELEGADIVVIGTPMHNFGVPSALKAWIDHVVRARRTFDIGPAGKVSRLRDRPVFIAIASGGHFSGDRARQPDFLTPYLKAILATIGLKSLVFFSVQSTSSAPEVLAEIRARTDKELQAYFSAFVTGASNTAGKQSSQLRP